MGGRRMFQQTDGRNVGRVDTDRRYKQTCTTVQGACMHACMLGMYSTLTCPVAVQEEVGQLDALQRPGENLRNDLEAVQAELATAKMAAAADAERIVEHEKTEAGMKEELERLQVEQEERKVWHGTHARTECSHACTGTQHAQRAHTYACSRAPTPITPIAHTHSTNPEHLPMACIHSTCVAPADAHMYR